MEAILNLGCGEDRLPGALNVDIDPTVNPDQVVDLQDAPWPWPEDSFKLVIARHVLEHLDPVPWSEIERVAQNGGELELTYPIGHTRFEDPTHKQFWNAKTADWLASPENHEHETPIDAELIGKGVSWRLWPPNPIAEVTTRLRLSVFGPGAWMDQVTGLYGEVTARYRL